MRLLRIFLVACAVLAAYTAAALWRGRHNVLESYPEWTSEKMKLALGVNGAHAFALAPVTLLGGALNLGAWLGHQEVTLERGFASFPSLSVRLRSRGMSEWTLLAIPAAQGRPFGLRFSSRPDRPSAWLTLGGDRAILSRRGFVFTMPQGEWVAVELTHANGFLELSVDGMPVSAFAYPAGAWRLSFHGSSSEGSMQMDDLDLRAGTDAYGQSFDGVFPWGLFAVLAAGFAGLLLALARFGGPKPAGAVALTLGGLAFLFLLFHDSWIGNQYPQGIAYRRKSTIETADEVHARLAALAPGPPVLLWLGGSQAWGAGASRPELSAFGRLAARLTSPRLELVNGAASGTTVEQQPEALDLVAKKRKVLAVVLTTGVNDAHNARFLEKLSLVHEKVKERGAKLLLVAEPVDPPASEEMKLRHQQILNFAADRGLPVVNLQALMDRESDSGFHWWDFVHLSDSGAALVASELEGPVRKLLATPR